MKKTLDIRSLIRPELVNIKAYSSARDEFSTDQEMVFLDANENPFNTSLNRYPDPYQSKLKSKISSLKQVDISQIVLGNGSDEIIDLLIRLFCVPYKDKVMTFPPTYGMYKVTAELNAIGIQEVHLNENFQLNVKEVLEQITADTKVIFFCTPNNPSGNTLNRKEVISILNHFKGIVVIDEAYQDFSTETSFVDLLQDYNNIVVMQTFSKAYGLAGARLGMCFTNPEIVNYLNKIKPPYNINSLSQREAIKRLSSQDSVQKEIELLVSERQKLEEALTHLSWVKHIYPSQANFLLVKVDDANSRYKQCLDHNIVVRNRHTQPNCKNCLRFTVGTPEENALLLQTLKRF
jgi:histidinol-phosphate aminotransferase